MDWLDIGQAPKDGTWVLLYYPESQHEYRVGKYVLFNDMIHQIEGWVTFGLGVTKEQPTKFSYIKEA